MNENKEELTENEGVRRNGNDFEINQNSKDKEMDEIFKEICSISEKAKEYGIQIQKVGKTIHQMKYINTEGIERNLMKGLEGDSNDGEVLEQKITRNAIDRIKYLLNQLEDCNTENTKLEEFKYFLSQQTGVIGMNKEMNFEEIRNAFNQVIIENEQSYNEREWEIIEEIKMLIKEVEQTKAKPELAKVETLLENFKRESQYLNDEIKVKDKEENIESEKECSNDETKNAEHVNVNDELKRIELTTAISQLNILKHQLKASINDKSSDGENEYDSENSEKSTGRVNTKINKEIWKQRVLSDSKSISVSMESLKEKWEGKINDKKKQHEDEIIKTMLSEINQTSEDNTFNANDCIVKENSESLSENKKEKMNEPVLLQNVEKGKEDSEFTIEKTQEHFFVLNDVDESFPTFNTVKKEPNEPEDILKILMDTEENGPFNETDSYNPGQKMETDENRLCSENYCYNYEQNLSSENLTPLKPEEKSNLKIITETVQIESQMEPETSQTNVNNSDSSPDFNNSVEDLKYASTSTDRYVVKEDPSHEDSNLENIDINLPENNISIDTEEKRNLEEFKTLENITLKPIPPLRKNKSPSVPALNILSSESDVSFNQYTNDVRVPPPRSKTVQKKKQIKSGNNICSSYSMSDISGLEDSDINWQNMQSEDTNISKTNRTIYDVSFSTPEISDIVYEERFLEHFNPAYRASVCLIDSPIQCDENEDSKHNLPTSKTPYVKRKSYTFTKGDTYMQEIKSKVKLKKSKSVGALLRRTFSLKDIRKSDNPPCMPNLFKRFKERKKSRSRKSKKLPTIEEEERKLPTSSTTESFASIFLNDEAVSTNFNSNAIPDDGLNLSYASVAFPDPTGSLRRSNSSIDVSQYVSTVNIPPTKPKRIKSMSSLPKFPRLKYLKNIQGEASSASLDHETLKKAKELLDKSLGTKQTDSPTPPKRLKSRLSLNSLSPVNLDELDIENNLFSDVSYNVIRKPLLRQDNVQSSAEDCQNIKINNKPSSEEKLVCNSSTKKEAVCSSTEKEAICHSSSEMEVTCGSLDEKVTVNKKTPDNSFTTKGEVAILSTEKESLSNNHVHKKESVSCDSMDESNYSSDKKLLSISYAEKEKICKSSKNPTHFRTGGEGESTVKFHKNINSECSERQKEVLDSFNNVKEQNKKEEKEKYGSKALKNKTRKRHSIANANIEHHDIIMKNFLRRYSHDMALKDSYGINEAQLNELSAIYDLHVEDDVKKFEEVEKIASREILGIQDINYNRRNFNKPRVEKEMNSDSSTRDLEFNGEKCSVSYSDEQLEKLDLESDSKDDLALLKKSQVFTFPYDKSISIRAQDFTVNKETLIKECLDGTINLKLQTLAKMYEKDVEDPKELVRKTLRRGSNSTDRLAKVYEQEILNHHEKNLANKNSSENIRYLAKKYEDDLLTYFDCKGKNFLKLAESEITNRRMSTFNLNDLHNNYDHSVVNVECESIVTSGLLGCMKSGNLKKFKKVSIDDKTIFIEREEISDSENYEGEQLMDDIEDCKDSLSESKISYHNSPHVKTQYSNESSRLELEEIARLYENKILNQAQTLQDSVDESSDKEKLNNNENSNVEVCLKNNELTNYDHHNEMVQSEYFPISQNEKLDEEQVIISDTELETVSNKYEEEINYVSDELGNKSYERELNERTKNNERRATPEAEQLHSRDITSLGEEYEKELLSYIKTASLDLLSPSVNAKRIIPKCQNKLRHINKYSYLNMKTNSIGLIETSRKIYPSGLSRTHSEDCSDRLYCFPSLSKAMTIDSGGTQISISAVSSPSGSMDSLNSYDYSYESDMECPQHFFVFQPLTLTKLAANAYYRDKKLEMFSKVMDTSTSVNRYLSSSYIKCKRSRNSNSPDSSENRYFSSPEVNHPHYNPAKARRLRPPIQHLHLANRHSHTNKNVLRLDLNLPASETLIDNANKDKASTPTTPRSPIIKKHVYHFPFSEESQCNTSLDSESSDYIFNENERKTFALEFTKSRQSSYEENIEKVVNKIVQSPLTNRKFIISSVPATSTPLNIQENSDCKNNLKQSFNEPHSPTPYLYKNLASLRHNPFSRFSMQRSIAFDDSSGHSFDSIDESELEDESSMEEVETKKLDSCSSDCCETMEQTPNQNKLECQLPQGSCNVSEERNHEPENVDVHESVNTKTEELNLMNDENERQEKELKDGFSDEIESQKSTKLPSDVVDSSSIILEGNNKCNDDPSFVNDENENSEKEEVKNNCTKKTNESSHCESNESGNAIMLMSDATNTIKMKCSLNCECHEHSRELDVDLVKILAMQEKSENNPDVVFRTWSERQHSNSSVPSPVTLPKWVKNDEVSPRLLSKFIRDTPSPGPPSDSTKDTRSNTLVGSGSDIHEGEQSLRKEEDRTQKDRCVEVYPETLRQRQRNMAPSPSKVDIKNWEPSAVTNEEGKKFLPSVKALRSQFENGKVKSSSNTLTRSSSSNSSSTNSLVMSSLENSSGFGSLTSSQVTLEPAVAPSHTNSVAKTGEEEPVEPIFSQFKEADEELKQMMSKPPSTQGWNPQALLKRLYYIPDAPKMQRRETPCVNIEGYLEKLPSGRKKATFWNAWKRRYFVAKDGILYYYQNNQSEKPNMKLPLMGGKIEIMDPTMVSVDDGGREARSAGMLGIDDGKGHYVVVRCPSRQEAERWKKALETHTLDDFSGQYVQPWPRPTNPTLLRDTLVIDIGSCSVRAGVLASQPTLPQLFFPSVVATHRETKKQVWGIEALMPEVRSNSSLAFPIRPSHKISKFSVDLNSVSSLLQKTFNDLKVDPKNYNIQLSVPRVLNPHTQAELLKILFEKFGVKSVNMTHQSILALYAYNATSGIIVDIGERLDVVPVIDGYIVDGGVSRVPYGGYRIMDHLRQFLFQKNLSLVNEVESYCIRQVLESICYCAKHYNTEKQRCTLNSENFEKCVPLAEYFPESSQYEVFKNISLDFGRFQATEGLFNPDAWGLDHPGLHKLVHKAIQECSMDIRKEMSRSIFLSGGVSQLSGIADRLSVELDNLTPPAIRPVVHASPYRYHAAYLGACVLAESEAFAQSKITKDEWTKQGSSALRKWAL